MVFALGVAKIVAVMAFCCHVAVLWVRTAHAIAQRHTENASRNGESKMRVLERMYRTRTRALSVSDSGQCCFPEVAKYQLTQQSDIGRCISLNSVDKKNPVSITFHSDSIFESESNSSTSAIATAETDWELYGDNVINFCGKRKRKEAVL